jgi:hypothetical protein
MGERQADISRLIQSMSASINDQINAAIVDTSKVIADARLPGNPTQVSDSVSKEHELTTERLTLLSAFEEARFNLFLHVLSFLIRIQFPESRARFLNLGLRIRDDFDRLATSILISKREVNLSTFGLQLSRLYESIAKEMASIQF